MQGFALSDQRTANYEAEGRMVRIHPAATSSCRASFGEDEFDFFRIHQKLA